MRSVVNLVDNASRKCGGIFESVLGFSNALAARVGWRVHVAAIDDDETHEDRSRWEGVHVLLARPQRIGLFSSRLARIAVTATPDIVHVHGVWGPAARAGWRLAKQRPELGVVVSPHGMLDPWALRNSRWKKELGWRAWAGKLLARADVIHALGSPERDAIFSLVPDATVVTIPNGVQLASASHAKKESAASVLLYLGRIHPKKGLVALVDAWARTGSKSGCWRLVIAGWDDGGHDTELKRQCERLQVGDHVSFSGPVFGAAKDALLRSADAFILPSHSEGLPMAVLEAWSYGLPVLMTEECNLPEGFAAGAAVRIKPECQSIVDSLKAFMEMPFEERLAMGARGRLLVESQFSWQQGVESLAREYEAILAPRSTAGTSNSTLQP